jgi:galactokinase
MTHGSVTAFAPGRVNLLGEHTDYNGGLALPFAIDRGVRVRVTALPGPLTMVRARDLRETDIFDTWNPGSASGWRAYVRGTVAELAAAGHPTRAARLDIAGTLPRGSGLSSSAALCCALALALLGIAGVEDPDRAELAKLCSRVENNHAGAQTGLLDQLASLLGRPGHALRIDFTNLAAAPVPLRLEDWKLAVFASGERRQHAASGYNDRRRECREAAERLGVAHLAHADRGAAEALEEPWRSRALHVLDEDARVETAVDALRRGDIAALGPLLDASHASLRDQFAVSTPAVDAAVERCRAAGAAGARLIGGGFGGHVLGLYPPGAKPPAGARTVEPGAGALVT